MQLPTEVRLRILRELLWQHEAVRIDVVQVIEDVQYCGSIEFERRPTSTLHPAVLRVCRKLRDEGEPILYSNTFGCDLWYDDRSSISHASLIRRPWDILRENPHMALNGVSVTAVPWSLMQRIRKLDLQVHIGYHGSLLELRTGIRKFVEASRRLGRLANLTVSVRFAVESFNEVYQGVSEDIFEIYDDTKLLRCEFKDLTIGPLASMRHLQNVCIEGATKDLADRLAISMTCSAEVKDLPRMFDSLSEYVNNHMKSGHCDLCERAHDCLETNKQAVDTDDPEMFENVRKHTLSLIDDHHRRERRALHRCDQPYKRQATAENDEKTLSDEQTPFETRWPRRDWTFFDPDDGETPEYEDLEPDHVRKAREMREKQDPVLKKLHGIWRYDCSERRW